MRSIAVVVVLAGAALAGCAPKYTKDASPEVVRSDLRACKHVGADEKRRVLARGGSREAASAAQRGAYDACARRRGFTRVN